MSDNTRYYGPAIGSSPPMPNYSRMNIDVTNVPVIVGGYGRYWGGKDAWDVMLPLMRMHAVAKGMQWALRDANADEDDAPCPDCIEAQAEGYCGCGPCPGEHDGCLVMHVEVCGTWEATDA